MPLKYVITLNYNITTNMYKANMYTVYIFNSLLVYSVFSTKCKIKNYNRDLYS